MELIYAYESQGVWDADFILQLEVKVSERFFITTPQVRYANKPLHGFPVCTISKFTYPKKCQNIDF